MSRSPLPLLQRLLAVLLFIPRILLRLTRGLLTLLLGRLSWSAPGWLRGLGRLAQAGGQRLRRHPRRSLAGGLLLALLAGAGGYAWHWYASLPQPHRVAYSVQAPALTDYRSDPMRVAPLVVDFAESAAPLAAIGKPVDGRLVSLEPAIDGSWQWASDRKLVFNPAGDWPVGQRYRLRLSEDGLLAAGVLLDSYSAEFSSQPFRVSVGGSELYQDPSIASLKKLVATLNFSHPVDEDSLRQRVAIILERGLAYRDPDQPSAPEISFDKLRLSAYVHSAPLATPLETVAVTLQLDPGVRAAAGGDAHDQALQARVSVPGRYQLGFSSARIQFVDNSDGEPEPVIMFDSSSAVADEAIAGKLSAWLLPERTPNDSTYWSREQIDEATLARSEQVALEHVPSIEPLNSLHAFRFRAPPGRYLYLRLPAQIEAIGGYLARHPTESLLQMPDYPRALRFLGDGALLGINGERRLGFLVRGMDAVDVEVARLLPNQLHHLVDQAGGSFARPYLSNDYFDRMVERERLPISLPPGDPAKTRYDHVDLNPYLSSAGGRRGVFVVRIGERREGSNPADRPTFEYYGSDNSDLRFIVVTDLGIIAKRSADGSQDVFVQSIASGLPVSGAKVEILGRNGLPVQSGETDADGRAHFAGLGDLRREKTPLMVVASLGSDLSFLPLGRYSHRLDLSRFDIGGLTDAADGQRLRAYLFSDRGLYRPGETAQLGMLVRRDDWGGSLAGLPLELQILDPRGLLVQRQRLDLPASGLLTASFASSEVAPAGEYVASLNLIGEQQRRIPLGDTRFKVRDFEPDRMKVAASLSAAPVRGWIAPDAVTAKVDAQHLFGAPASDRRVVADLRLTPGQAAFSAWPEYRFRLSNPLEERFEEVIEDLTTDANGQAVLDLRLERFARSTYRIDLLARVFEAEGGRNVAAHSSLLVASAPWLVGVRSQDSLRYVSRDAVREIDWQAVGPDLAAVAVDGLQAELIEHRYLSVLVKQSDGTYRYESRRKEISLSSTPLAIPAAGLRQKLETGTPGEFSLRLKTAEGELLNQVDYSVAGSGNASRSLERNAELQLKLDKASYAPGEEIELSLRAPYAGAGLITIEREKIFAQQWFKADGSSSVQRIRLPAGIEGNAYVSVQFVRDPGSSEVYMSPLSYAVAPFAIDLDARRQPLAIRASERLEPGQSFQISLSAERPGQALVYAVDAGILQVARYRTPDPLGHFFQKRALQVQTSQILDLILPEFRLLLAQAAAGGDGEGALAAQLNPFKRKRQAPVAWWSGLIELPAGETTLEYPVPEHFNGQLRWFVVSIDDSRVGVHEGAAEVRGPLVISPNVPAMVAPGDEFLVTAGVFSNLGKAAEVKVSLQTDAGLELLGETQTLSIEPRREAVARFRLKALEQLGSSELRVIAELPDGKRIGIGESISVRPAVAHRVQLSLGRLTSERLELPPTRTLFPQLRQVELGLGASPLVWSQGLGDYLSGYGYSCTEQLLSKAMPTLIWNSPALGLSPEARGSFEAALGMLRQRQNQSGGFGLWAASPEADAFASAYAADFLIEARERGFAVPDDLLGRANGYLSRLAEGPSQGMAELRLRAYASYLLTRQGVVTSGALADIHERYQTYFKDRWEQDIGAAYLAASYRLLKQDKQARALFAKVPWRTLGKPLERDSLYYDALVHDAERLALLSRHFPEQLDELPDALLDGLARQLARNQYNSLSAALLVRALDSYGRVGEQQVEVAAAARLGEQLQPLALSGKPPRAAVPLDTRMLELSRKGELPAFYLLSEAGFDRGPLSAELSQGLEISRDYLSLDGQPLQALKVGDEFLVRLRLRAVERERVEQLAVVDLLPGGVEPVYNNPLPDENGELPEGWQSPLGNQPGSDWQPHYADVRDDRVVLYGNVSRDAATFVYRARATNAGRFGTPPPYAESMYEPSLQARGASGLLEIGEP